MIYPSEAGADVIFGVKADLKSSQTSVNVEARNVHDSHSSQMVNLGDVFHDLARQKESRVLEGHLQSDHVHMLISIPPKYAVSQVVGYMKGKSAIHIARTYLGQRKNYSGMSFWARGYFVSTVGADEEVVRAYIREQEQEDHRVEQLQLFR